MRLDCPAWPPGASRSTSTGRSPSDAPYTAGASPARPVSAGGEPRRPTTDDHEVVVLLRGLVRDVEALGELEDGRTLEDRAVLEQRDGKSPAVDADDAQQLSCLAVTLDVEPAGGDAVAGEEVADVVGLLREAVA